MMHRAMTEADGLAEPLGVTRDGYTRVIRHLHPCPMPNASGAEVQVSAQPRGDRSSACADGGNYRFPRRERRTEGFAREEAVLDIFFVACLEVAFFAAGPFSALPALAVGEGAPDRAPPGRAVERGPHFAQRPSSLDPWSCVTSTGPAISTPQDVVVVAILVRRCHSPDAPAARKSGRIQSDTASVYRDPRRCKAP